MDSDIDVDLMSLEKLINENLQENNFCLVNF